MHTFGLIYFILNVDDITSVVTALAHLVSDQFRVQLVVIPGDPGEDDLHEPGSQASGRRLSGLPGDLPSMVGTGALPQDGGALPLPDHQNSLTE